MFLLCHPWFTTTNLSYTFPISEASATASSGTTGNLYTSLETSQTCLCLVWNHMETILMSGARIWKGTLPVSKWVFYTISFICQLGSKSDVSFWKVGPRGLVAMLSWLKQQCVKLREVVLLLAKLCFGTLWILAKGFLRVPSMSKACIPRRLPGVCFWRGKLTVLSHLHGNIEFS